MLNFNDFGNYFMLVGFSLSRNQETGKEKIYLHFIYKLNNGSGYGTFRTTKEKDKLFAICPEKDFHIGGIYDIRTDKFLNEKKELITFLKDIRLVKKEC